MLSQRPLAVRSALEDYLKPFLLGKDVLRSEDLWQTMMVNAYWRNGPVLNNAISGVDMALWDIKGKLANMPVYQLLGGKCREAALVYRRADGREEAQVLERVQELLSQGHCVIRCQMGGYGGAKTVISGSDRALPGMYFDPAAYARSIPRLFAYLRTHLGDEVELLHDVHERLAPSRRSNWQNAWSRIASSSWKTRCRQSISAGLSGSVSSVRCRSQWANSSTILTSGCR